MSSNMVPNKDVRTLGLVLRRTNYAEADRILNIITPLGKMVAIARGVRKARSKLAGGVEMFTLSDYNIHLGRGEMGIVTGVRMVEHYGEIMKDFGRMELMGGILKKIDRASEGSDNVEFFEIAKQSMEALDTGACLALVESWLDLNLMKAMGEEVNLYRDRDGVKLEAGRDYDWDVASESFYADAGGRYGTNEIKLLRLMQTANLKTVRRVKIPEEMHEKVLDLVRTMAKM